MYETYYESWKLLNEIDVKYGQEFIDALFRLGLYGEVVEVSPVVRPSLAIANKLIEIATDRYQAARENGQKGGRPRKVDWSEMYQMMRDGYSDKEIAEHFEVTQDYIRKKRKERDDYNEKNRKGAFSGYNPTVTDTVTATVTETVTDTDNVNDNSTENPTDNDNGLRW